MEELVKMINMWKRELEKQNAGMGTMSVFDSICTYLGEKEREIEFLRFQRELLENTLQHYRGYN